jgi:hypothetical protein
MAKVKQLQYPTVDWIIETVDDFIDQQRHRRAALREFDALGAAEASAIARDLGVTETELRALAVHEDGIPKLLEGMLSALKITSEDFQAADRCLTRDMQSLCSVCNSKSRCRRELAGGRAAATFRTFCPNASNLEMLSDPAKMSRPAPLPYI